MFRRIELILEGYGTGLDVYQSSSDFSAWLEKSFESVEQGGKIVVTVKSKSLVGFNFIFPTGSFGEHERFSRGACEKRAYLGVEWHV